MEEGDGVKAAVLRPRRRPSVEQPESPNPATPTKKRSTRLAAKPQLELIDEHAVTNSPSKRTTRKSIARELIEPEEKPVTPARRSARVKSNTSLVLEAEEKTATPAKRSTRIKSNTSILSETTQAEDTPRTKRAARRFSQTGSDTEVTLTPARVRRTRKTSTSSIDKEGTPSISETAVTPARNRRTRKGSTSSIDNTPAEASPADKPTSLITEVIVEEPENKLRKSTIETDNDENRNESPTTRRSPRIMAKKSIKNDASNDVETSKDMPLEISNHEMKKTEDSSEVSTANTDVPKHDISVTTSNLIRDLDTKPKNKTNDKNKSMSDIEDFKTKRNRTKSWSTLSSPIPDSNFFSDNESTKKKLKKNRRMIKIVIDKRLSGSGSGDGQEQVSSNKAEETSLNTSKKSRKSKRDSLTGDTETPAQLDISNESNKENILCVVGPSKDSSAVDIMLEKAPSEIKTTVFIEDSDSNSGSINKSSCGKNNEADDQCVPVVLDPDEKQTAFPENVEQNIFAVNTERENDLSVEPMDIDETMPENISLTVFNETGKQSRKSSLCLPQESDKESPNKSKRKSSLSTSVSQILNNDNIEEHRENEKSHKSLINISQDSDHPTLHKSKRKSSISQALSQDSDTGKDKSKRKSSVSYTVNEEKINISTEQRSSFSENNEESETQNIKLEKSFQSSPKDNLHKSIRKSSTSQGSDTDKDILKKSKRKSSVSHTVDQDKINISTKQQSSFSENTELGKSFLQEPESTTNGTPNKSTRKSSLSNSIAQDLDKTQNENKTTLVLSQIKDISAESNTSTSPQEVKEKSVNQTAKDGPANKNLALDYLTSTPVQQKNIEKITMQMNTSVITPTNVSKKEFKDTSNTSETEEIGHKKKKSKRLSESVCKEISLEKVTPKNNLSKTVSSMNESSSDDSEESDEDEESLKNKSSFLNDEAEDAGEDYESGDSQDEEERLYEKENEILENGETLTSEDEDSDDTDYEKDSFIVSSAEEDNDLLSGSGDDLDMSDNELRMNAKSKKKYNERKLKEQKNASREMYESRHGLKKLDKAQSKQNGRNRLDSTLLKSDDDNLPPKKNKRMRLESSTLETSEANSDSEETTKKNVNNVSGNEDVGYVKKKTKRLSESLCNASLNENEMTIINTKGKMPDPLSLNVKVEPKTPQKYLEISTYQINEEIEEIQVDENASMMKPNDTIDPLQATMKAEENESDDEESISENEEITNNYDSVLKQLNEEWKNPIKSHDISLNLNKKSKKTKEPIIDELNLTGTKSSRKLRDDSKEAKQKSVKRVFKKLAEEDESSKDSIDLNLLFSDESNDKPDEAIDKHEGSETFIHLKRTDAKTDILKSSDLNEGITNQSINTRSKKKNRKSKGAVTESGDAELGESVEVFNFFIDTKGDLADKESKDVQDSDLNEPPVEVFYVNQKNKKTNNSSEAVAETTEEPKTSTTEKKKKKKLSESLNVAEVEFDTETIKTPKSDKKKKHFDSQNTNPLETTTLEANTSSEKKKKKKLSVSSEQPDNVESEIQSHKTSLTKNKTENISLSQDDIHQAEPAKTPNPKKKKKKKSESENETSQTEIDNIPKPVMSVKNQKESESLKDIESPAKPTDVTGAKKRKRNTSANDTIDLNSSQKADESMVGRQKKKIKVSHASSKMTVENVPQINEPEEDHTASKKSKKNKRLESETTIKQSKKRKQKDGDDGGQASKIFKEYSFDKVHVPRLPSSILAQLDSAPQLPERQKNKVVSTSNFVIEEIVKRKNKPSKYLEESVFLNEDSKKKTVEMKTKLQKPKVLPFLPVASTSDSGFTTNFRVKVISDTMEFVAKSNDVPNFKNDYLSNKKMKKLRTYDLYKKQRYMKLTKY